MNRLFSLFRCFPQNNGFQNSISRKRQTPALLLFLATAGFAAAQETLTLPHAIEIALQNNYSIRIVKNQQQAAENNYNRGNAGFLPSVTAGAQTNNNYNALFRQQRKVPQTVINPVTKDTSFREVTQINEFNGRTNNAYSANVTLNWTVFDGFAMFANYDRLAEIRAAGRENTKAAIENTVADVTNAYFAIIQQERRRIVFEDALKISEQRLKLARNRYEVGSGSKQDYLSAQVDYNADQSALIGQEQQIANAKIAVNQLLARPAGTAIAASDTIIVNPNLNLAGLQGSVEKQNTNLLVAQRNRNVAYLDTKIVRAQRLPQVNVFGAVTRGYQNSRAFIVPNLTNSAVVNYGASVNINIFNGGIQNRFVQNARIAQETAGFQYEDLRNQVLAGLESAFVAYANNLKLIELERQNLAVARQNVVIALERYKTGVSTPLEVRDVQRNAVAAESRLIDATYNAKASETELLRLSSQIVR